MPAFFMRPNAINNRQFNPIRIEYIYLNYFIRELGGPGMMYEVDDDVLLRAQTKLVGCADDLDDFGIDADDDEKVEDFKKYMTVASMLCTVAFLGAVACQKAMSASTDQENFEKRLASHICSVAVDGITEIGSLVKSSKELVDHKVDRAVMRAKGVAASDLGDLFAEAMSKATGIPVEVVKGATVCAIDPESGEMVDMNEVIKRFSGDETGRPGVDGEGFLDGVMEFMKEKGEEE